jgi:hypothetical protein
LEAFIFHGGVFQDEAAPHELKVTMFGVYDDGVAIGYGFGFGGAGLGEFEDIQESALHHIDEFLPVDTAPLDEFLDRR